jgi:hypothetical protein
LKRLRNLPSTEQVKVSVRCDQLVRKFKSNVEARANPTRVEDLADAAQNTYATANTLSED